MLPVPAAMAAAVSSQASALRLDTTTVAPSRARPRAIARPSPRVAPVTRATLPSSSPVMRSPCFLSSSRAIVRRCTSVGPSAICSARVIANSRARTVSSLTPAAPYVWTARLTTVWAISMAATLIAATSERAAALPGGVHQPGRLERQQPDLVDLHAAAGDPLAHDTAVGQRSAEGLAGDGAAAHQLQSALGEPDGPHRVVHAAGPEPALGDREAVALLAEHVGRPARVRR